MSGPMSVVNPRQSLGLVGEGTGQKRAHLMGRTSLKAERTGCFLLFNSEPADCFRSGSSLLTTLGRIRLAPSGSGDFLRLLFELYNSQRFSFIFADFSSALLKTIRQHS